ncbi:MAG: AraC family transcriptional regulator [Pseudomonadota bacterium]
MSIDPLSQIVGSLALSGAVFLRADFTAPWAVTAHVTEEDCRPFAPMPRQVIAYHLVVEGEVLVSLGGANCNKTHYRARAGDVIFLPTNALHVLASTASVTPVSGDDLLLPAGQDGLVRIEHGGGGDPTRMLCGFIASGSAPAPLFAGLPELLVINIESLDTRRWIEASVALAARELCSGRVSSSTMVTNVCRLLLIEALRSYVEQCKAPSGWLGGMAHPRMSRALARIHADLAAPLRVEDLASQVGMSRSAFVDRFTEVVGVSPRRYILIYRIETAAALLRNTELTIAEIAHRVGYDAPEAFSRAFKREMGQSPADWRHIADMAA